MVRNALFSVIAVGLLASVPLDAHADKETSAVHYKNAKKKYNLGDFEEAIVLFKKAYDEHEAPAYLYNIAQAYRQLNDCKKSLFFYERFLAEKPGSSQEETIKGYVAALKEECPDDASDVGSLNEVDEPVHAKPTTTEVAQAPAAETRPATTDGPAVSKRLPPSEPRGPMLRLGADAGFSVLSMGDVVTPLSPTLALSAAYLMALGDIELQLGARIGLSTLAYETADGDSSLLFTNYQLTAGAGYPLAPGLSVGGDIALGMKGYSAIDAGNPFIDGEAEAEGASNFSFALAAGAEYALSETLGVSGSLGYGSSGVGDEFAADITSIGTVTLLGGVRYRW